jgi:prophage regulatory protein
MERIVREAECRRLTGLSRTTRWTLERQGRFPARRRLAGHTIGWNEAEVLAWIAGRKPVRPGAAETARAVATSDGGPPR